MGIPARTQTLEAMPVSVTGVTSVHVQYEEGGDWVNIGTLVREPDLTGGEPVSVTSRTKAVVQYAAKVYRVTFTAGPFIRKRICFYRYYVASLTNKEIARLAFDILRGKRG